MHNMEHMQKDHCFDDDRLVASKDKQSKHGVLINGVIHT